MLLLRFARALFLFFNSQPILERGARPSEPHVLPRPAPLPHHRPHSRMSDWLHVVGHQSNRVLTTAKTNVVKTNNEKWYIQPSQLQLQRLRGFLDVQRARQQTPAARLQHAGVVRMNRRAVVRV
jgi:hypothetical protein